MSNKTLGITVVIIVLVFAAAVAGYRWNANRKTASDTFSNNQTSAQLAPDVSQQPTASSTVSTTTPLVTPKPTLSTSSSTTKPTSMDTCTRNFDQNKLDTAKVSINNRAVEIDVAGYGKIQLAFYEKDAPKAVENFLRLANSGYYNCLTFHRIAKGFVIQAGDPKGNGTGGQSAFGQPFTDELNADTDSYKAGYQKGVLAMANSGPDTNGSQFFIMLDTVPLNHAYTIFGKVTSGLNVIDKIGQSDITVNPAMGGNDGAPVKPVVMQSVKIVK